MSELLDLQQKIQDTSATIAEVERAFAANPSIILRINLDSLVARFDSLEAQFKSLADRRALDVCKYRFFKPSADNAHPTVRGFSAGLLDFQQSISALYDALRNGRRLRTRLSPDVIEATKLDIAYAFPGSLGVVLTMPHERLLFAGDLLDDTVTTFFSLASAPAHDDISEIGRRLGPAPLRAIYGWAQAHVEEGLGADILWSKGGEVSGRLFLEPEQLQRLSDAIAATSEETVETLEATGMLTGAMTGTRRFTFSIDGGDDISGTYSDAINEAHAVTLPRRYRVRLEKITKIQYSTEEPQLSWRLVSLTES